jgi:hypothetical protein
VIGACSPWARGWPEESSGCSIPPYNENILLHLGKRKSWLKPPSACRP